MRSSRPTRRSVGFDRMRRSGRGCCRSWPTKRAIDAARQGGARTWCCARATTSGRPLGDAAPSPEAAALAEEQRQSLLAAVEGLRDEDRQAIALRYFLDLSEAEMAAALGCARGTVKSRLSRALGRLRERFTEVRHG